LRRPLPIMSTDRHHATHGDAVNPTHADVSFEPKDVQVNPILKFLLYLGIAIVASYFLTLGIYRGLGHYWAHSYTPPPPSRVEGGVEYPPEPRLQGMPGHLVDPQSDLREKLKKDNEANNNFGWVDQGNGIAQIPVKDAMKLIVEKGLPAITVAPAETK
jgi:hypothetical protein